MRVQNTYFITTHFTCFASRRQMAHIKIQIHHCKIIAQSRSLNRFLLNDNFTRLNCTLERRKEDKWRTRLNNKQQTQRYIFLSLSLLLFFSLFLTLFMRIPSDICPAF